MNVKSKLNRVAVAVAISVGLSTAAVAQETSSAIRGVVESTAGQVVSNAKITITDTRTNISREFSTSDTGAFTARGLRVGGPYTVVVEDELGSRTITDVYTNLGESSSLNIELVSESDVERISITGSSTGVATEAIGPGSNYSFTDLQYQPSINRDIKDIIQTDPRVSIDPTNSDSIQCAGVNNRFNSLTVDGVQQNDNFGLNNNGFPTEGLPFPFDAIDQVDVQLAPFDVTYGGFTGCNINAVFRSGENDVFGTVFYDYTDDSLQGDSTSEGDFDVPAFNQSRYGFAVGAPIIKDKLFIFAAYEKDNPTEIFENGPEGAGFAQPIEGLTTDLLADIASIASSVYGYDVGDIANSGDNTDEKLLVKLDWQINEAHRAALTYQDTESATAVSTGLGTNSFAFNDRFYERANDLQTLALSVYSDWTDSFFTEFRISRTDVDNGQVANSSNSSFGDFTINDAIDGVDVRFGADEFRQANVLNYETENYKFAGTYYTGDHEITAGVEYQSNEVFNLFVPGSQGVFEFNGLENFRNQLADSIEFSIPGSLDPNDGAAEFEFRQFTLYAQDRWLVNDNLTLTFGLRYDSWDADRDPIANDNFFARYGITNATGPDFDLVQPRIGFNYVVSDDTFVYGGLGLFAGGNPNVWLSNNYSNNGVTILSSEVEREDDGSNSAAELAALDGANTANFGLEVPDFLINGLEGGDGAVNALDPDFEIPSLYKFNVGVQHEFGEGYIASADVIYTKEKNAPNTRPLNTVQIGTAADGRPIYTDVDLLDADCRADATSADCSGRSGTDYILENANEDGDGLILTTTLQKTWDNGISINAGYTYQDIEQGNPQNSSTASSNFGNLSVSDLNDPGIATSSFEVRHRFVLNLSYVKQFYKDYDTRINLFWNRQSGRPFSFNFDGDPGFGDERGFEDRNLLYVPTLDDPNVAYGDDFDLAAFNQFISDSGLEGSRGTILSRNSQRSSWNGRIDMRISQEFPGIKESHRGEFFIVVRNLANLLNDDWGNFSQVNFEFNNPVVDAELQSDGTYLFTNFDGDQGESLDVGASVWSARIGVKYTF
ncbi:TonB-dependent receptor [Alteromonas sp. 5E99-2]|uniref:TonB-dependent receptor n=1 Tax=Alteromonas sp. 5E99-2 TaxID=2817683 RepID=UPI001A98812B|nr:TonB-dependent receptor [Alteromonas sp. 5E99-2]MBO1254547.1 TonB-dependent receptor [Alteromonas sp. 5E99-2]